MFRKIVNKWHGLPITIKVSTAYASCSILQRGLSIITMPLFTRLLTTEQYGQSVLYSSWASLFAIAITLNLAWGSFGAAMMKFEDRRNEYISSLEGIFLLLGIFFIIIYIPLKSFWNNFFQLPTFFVLLLVIEQIMTNSILLWTGKKRYEFKYKGFVVVTLLTSFLSPLVAYFFIMCTEEKGWARVFGYSVVSIAIGGFIFFINILKGKKLYSKEFWKYAFGFNIPLVPYYLSQMIFNQSDRIMISHYTGTSDAALYGVAYGLAMVLAFVSSAINGSYIPWLYGKIKENRQVENRKISVYISAMFSALILMLIWFAPEIILILAGEKYLKAVYVVPPVAMSLLLAFYTDFSTNIEFYYEEKWSLVFASIGAALCNIILNAIFIPRVGFIAAGYTTLFSYIIFATSNFVAMFHVLKKQGIEESGLNMKWLAIVFFVFAFLSFVGMALYRFRLIRLSIAITGLLVMVTQSKRVLFLLKSLKLK